MAAAAAAAPQPAQLAAPPSGPARRQLGRLGRRCCRCCRCCRYAGVLVSCSLPYVINCFIVGLICYYINHSTFITYFENNEKQKQYWTPCVQKTKAIKYTIQTSELCIRLPFLFYAWAHMICFLFVYLHVNIYIYIYIYIFFFFVYVYIYIYIYMNTYTFIIIYIVSI